MLGVAAAFLSFTEIWSSSFEIAQSTRWNKTQDLASNPPLVYLASANGVSGLDLSGQWPVSAGTNEFSQPAEPLLALMRDSTQPAKTDGAKLSNPLAMAFVGPTLQFTNFIIQKHFIYGFQKLNDEMSGAFYWATVLYATSFGLMMMTGLTKTHYVVGTKRIAAVVLGPMRPSPTPGSCRNASINLPPKSRHS